MRKAILLLLLAGVSVYLILAPFNPPVFFTILGMAIVGEIWCIDYLIRVRKEAKNGGRGDEKA